jgi:FkbM family methyltransferase
MIIPMCLLPSISFSMDLDHNVPTDSAMYWYLARSTFPEMEVIHAASHILRPGDRVIDGGACTGFHTLAFSRLVGPEGRVVAVEPARANADKLRGHLDLNAVGNTVVIEAALASATMSREFHLSNDGGLHSFWRGSDHTSKTIITTVRLDSLGVQPRLVKLDVEGAEVEALRGAGRMVQGWSAATIPYIICETNAPALELAGTSVAGLRTFLFDRGYDMWLLNIDGFLPMLVPEKTAFAPRRVNTNVLFATQAAVAEAWPEVSI